jgi:hypothetical protein
MGSNPRRLGARQVFWPDDQIDLYRRVTLRLIVQDKRDRPDIGFLL